MPGLRGPDGKIVYVRDDEVPRYTAGGDYQLVSPEAAGAAQSVIAPQDTGAIGAARAGLGSLLSGATLGLSDLVLTGMGTEGEAEQIAAERAAHPILSGLGQVAGAVLPSLISGGAATPAGYLSKLAGQGIEAGAATGGALGAAQSLTAAAAEGAVQNAGIYLSDVALGDRDLTAEGMTGALGTGLAFGASGAVAAHGIEAGTIAARRMFARYAEGGEKAAQLAAHEWEQTSKASLDAFDQTADMARARLAEAENARAQAGLARDQAAAGLAEAKAWTPPTEPVAGPPPAKALPPDAAARLFEGVDFAPGSDIPTVGQPATAVLRTPAPAETQLTAHLQEYTAARSEFEAMRARVDPDLEAALQGLGELDVQAEAVPIGEFSAPGEGGFKSQNELARLAAGTDAPGVAPALEQPGTRVLRGGARGTPEAKSLGEIAGESSLAPPPATAEIPEALPRGGIEVVRPSNPRTRGMELKLSDGTTRPLTIDEAAAIVDRETPAGFRGTAGVDIRQRFVINHEIPDTAADAIDNSLTIVKPSELVDRGVMGNELSDAHRDSVLEAWKEDKKLEPLRAYVMPDRLQAAARDNRDIAVTFKSGETYKPQAGARDITDRVRADLPKESASAPSDTLTGRFRGTTPHLLEADALESQLRGTLGGLAGGEALPAMGAPARAEYAAAKAERTAQAAEHFRAKAIEAHDVPEYQAIKAHETKADDYFEQTLPARKIADRGYYEPPGGGTDAARVGNARKAIAEGQRESIKLNVSPEGKITVTDGRHRLAAAIEADKPIKVKWSTGFEPAESDVWRNRKFELRDAAEAAARRAHPQAYQKMDDAYERYHASGDRYSTRDQGLGKTARDAQGEVRKLESDEARRLETSQAGSREHPLAVKQLEMAHDAALERAATAADPIAKREATAEAHAIEKQLTSVGARPGAVEDVAAMAKVTTRVEKAAADLVESMGPAAPPAAQQAAKAYRAAEETADRKMAARIAQAAEDHASSAAAAESSAASAKPGQGAPARQPTTRETKVAAAKQEKLVADAAHARAKVAETEARIGAKSATKAASEARAAAEARKPPGAPPPAPARGSKLLEGAKAVGVAMELGSDFGIPGIPKPHDIPVIGPVLSAYLKYRALRAAAGRFVGRVPATAEAKAAALAAKTKDAVARAVDRSLGLLERNIPATRTAIAATALKVTDALSRRAIDDGGPDAPKGASTSELAAVRMREVAAAVANPRLVLDHVRKQTQTLTDPDLIQALENHLTAMFAHLNETAPKGPPPNPYSKTEWLPSPAVALQWGRRYAVAQNPAVAFDALQAGTLTPDAAETLRVCYAKLFAMAQQRLTERAADIEHPVGYPQLIRNSLLFDLPLHASLDPENAAVLRTAHAPSAPDATGPGGAPPGGPPPPSIANGTNLTALYQTFSDRRSLAR